MSAMMSSLHSRKAVSRIRRLACLDASGPEMAPLLLQELAQVVQFDTGGYMYRRADGEMDVFMQSRDVMDIIPLYMDSYVQQKEREVARSFDDTQRQDFGAMSTESLVRVPWKDFLRHDYYNLILRPVELNQCLSLVPRLPDQTPVGALKLYRHSPVHPFSHEDARVMNELDAFLARALEPKRGLEPDAFEQAGEALVVATANGRPRWFSSMAAEYLTQAFGARNRKHDQSLPGPLLVLLQRLEQIRQERPGNLLPSLTIRNAHGVFSFDAYLLLAATGEEESAGIRITHRVPRALRILKMLERFALSPQQSETFYWMERGLSEAQIAERMGISQNTVVYHRRQLYARLGVFNRRELLDLLAAH